MHRPMQNMFLKILLLELFDRISQQWILLQQLSSWYLCKFEYFSMRNVPITMFGVHIFDELLH